MKRNIFIIGFIVLLSLFITAVSCVSTKVIAKTGSQLWDENCQRCHNSPPPSAFSNTQWEMVNTHMRQRAMLTETEYKKILEFLSGRE